MITERYIIHVTTPDAWQRQAGTPSYTPDSLAVEGFIHCCRLEQLRGVLGRHFAGNRALVLLVIDPDRLSAELREEESRPGDSYPHIYGPIDRVAVVSTYPVEADPTGSFILPASFE